MAELVSEIRFIPIVKNGSHVGFCDFHCHTEEMNFLFKDMAVHSKRSGGYRVVYTRNKVTEREHVKPQNKKTQEAIDTAITAYIRENGHGE